MNLYDACVVLSLWHVVKARAQVWAISTSDHSIALSDTKVLAKNKFKELALQHHPDKGGQNSAYLEIQEAHELIKSATLSDFINVLGLEPKNDTKFCTPGSMECMACNKWSDVVKICITTTCTGFKQHEKSIRSKFDIRRKAFTGVQTSGFFTRGSQDLGQETSRDFANQDY